MLLVKTYIGPSPIAGTGLFAAEAIAKGTVVWRFTPGLDRTCTAEEYGRLDPDEKARVAFWGYFSTRSRNWVLCGDDAKRVNHSTDPNLDGGYDDGSPEGYSFAARDIAAGEELTDDYTSYDATHALKLGGRINAPSAPGLDSQTFDEIEALISV